MEFIKYVRDWARPHLAALILVFVSLTYVGSVTILHDETASPIDELVYIDYTYKTLEQGMVFEGETFGDEVSQFVGCNAVFPYGTLGQDCDSEGANLSGMPNFGYTTGAPYTPVYFWITRVVGDSIHWITGISQVTSWRLTGSLWLAASMVLFAGLLKRWKIDAGIVVTLGLLFIASPFTWWTYSYLSTDVTAFLFGTLMLLLAKKTLERPHFAWWFIPLSFVAAVFKITNLLALGLVTLYFVINTVAQNWQARKDSSIESIGPKKVFTIGIAILVSSIIGALVQVVWMKLLPMLAVSSVRVDQGVSRTLSELDLIRLLLTGPGVAITHNPVAGVNGGELLSLAAAPLSWFAIASVFGSLMASRWSSGSGPVIWATAVSSLFALPALALAFSTLMGSYFDLPGRYAASLIPAVLLVGGFLFQNKFTSWLLRIYAFLLMLSGIILALFIRAMF